MNDSVSHRVLLSLFTILAFCAHNTCAADGESALNATNRDSWKTHILPTTEEQAWTQIPWLPDLQSAIDAAMESGKPVLLWTMNGHPLGCT